MDKKDETRLEVLHAEFIRFLMMHRFRFKGCMGKIFEGDCEIIVIRCINELNLSNKSYVVGLNTSTQLHPV